MRAREISLLEFQVAELDAAGLGDADEDAQLEAEEQRLADAEGIRESLASARHAVDGSVADGIAAAVAALAGRATLARGRCAAPRAPGGCQ